MAEQLRQRPTLDSPNEGQRLTLDERTRQRFESEQELVSHAWGVLWIMAALFVTFCTCVCVCVRACVRACCVYVCSL